MMAKAWRTTQATILVPSGVSVACVGLMLTGCDPGQSPPEAEAPLPVAIAELELRVGSLDDPDYGLTQWFRMAVDDAGRMFTVHPQEQIGRIFAADGTLERVFGGRGQGPGEFQSPIPVGWVADSLWVLDTANGRFSFFDAQGEFLSSFTVPFEPDPSQPQLPPRPEGLLWDGRIRGSPPVPSAAAADGTVTERQVMLIERDASVMRTLASIPLGSGGTLRAQSGGRSLFFSGPFRARPMDAVVPGEEALIVVDPRLPLDSDAATYTVSKLSFAGDTVISVRVTPLPVPISDAEVDAEIEAYAARAESVLGLAPAEARIQFEESLFRPRVRPGAEALFIGTTGEIWIREATAPPDSRWVVLSPDAEPLFRVAFPASVDLMVATENEAWGRLDDELGVPFLVRYRFERP